MASFVVLTAGSGLYLNHRLNRSYEETVHAGRRWTGRLDRYGRLADLSGRISVAGMDIYDSPQPQAGLPALLALMEQLDRDVGAARQELFEEGRRPGAEAALPRLVTRFDQMNAAQEGINNQISLLLTALRTERRDLGTRGMAAMNRQLAALQRALEELRGEVQDLQRRSQEAQQARAAALQRSERLIAALSVLMVAGVALFGVRLSRGARRQAQERERLLLSLRRRNEEMRLVLDNVGQGLLTLDLGGEISQERSAVLDHWFGPPAGKAQTFWEYIAPFDAPASALFALGWQAIVEDALPLELCLEQMPRRIAAGERSFRLDYQPVFAGQPRVLVRVLLIVSDVTARLERERAEAERREVLQIFEKVLRDRRGFLEFFAEAEKMVGVLTAPAPVRALPEVRRLLHTLKGNCAIFGLGTMARLCHDIESAMEESGAGMTPADRQRLARRFGELAERLGVLLGAGGPGTIEVEGADYEQMIEEVRAGRPHRALLRTLESWRCPPLRPRLERFAEQARELALRLGKAEPRVHVEPTGLRLDPERWREFFAAFAHAVRNAVDHGLEPPAERAAAGKSEAGQLLLRAGLRDGALLIEIGDDGRGIDWERLRQRACARGLPGATREDLVEALFADGVSTSEEVSEHSGRGVGMGALRAAARRLHGTISVESETGSGTLWRFRFPAEEAAAGLLVEEVRPDRAAQAAHGGDFH